MTYVIFRRLLIGPINKPRRCNKLETQLHFHINSQTVREMGEEQYETKGGLTSEQEILTLSSAVLGYVTERGCCVFIYLEVTRVWSNNINCLENPY